MQGVGAWGARLAVIAALMWMVAGVGSATPEAAIAAEVAGASEVNQLAAASIATTARPTTTIAATTSTESTTTRVVIEFPAPDRSEDERIALGASTAPTTSIIATTTTVAEPAPAVAPSLSRDELGRRAIAAMRIDVTIRFPAWTVEFLGARNGLRALTYPGERRIEVFVRESDTVTSLHRVLAHEYGHVADVELNDQADRERWEQQRGIPNGTPWWPGESAPDFATGAGDFAEAFAVWETGVTSQSSVGAQPSAADLALLAELVG